MKIAVDLDDTLSAVDRITQAAAYIKENGLPYRVVDPDAHMIGDVFDWDIPEMEEFIRRGGLTVFTEAPVREGVRETLTQWREQGHFITVLTARRDVWFGDAAKRSSLWLDGYGVPYDSVVANVQDKGAYCKEHGYSVIIDDYFETCLRAQELGINAILAVGKNNEAQADKICYHGRDWKEIDEQFRLICSRQKQ